MGGRLPGVAHRRWAALGRHISSSVVAAVVPEPAAGDIIRVSHANGRERPLEPIAEPIATSRTGAAGGSKRQQEEPLGVSQALLLLLLLLLLLFCCCCFSQQ